MKTAAFASLWTAFVWIASFEAQERAVHWEFSQQVRVLKPGLVELNLPEAVIDRAQSSLQDLRLEGADSSEVGFYLKLPSVEYSAPSVVLAAKRFAVSLEERQTLVLVETGTEKILEALQIETSSRNFLKSVTVEGSADREKWQVLIRNQPFFSQDAGSGMELRLPKGIWRIFESYWTTGVPCRCSSAAYAFGWPLPSHRIWRGWL